MIIGNEEIENKGITKNLEESCRDQSKTRGRKDRSSDLLGHFENQVNRSDHADEEEQADGYQKKGMRGEGPFYAQRRDARNRINRKNIVSSSLLAYLGMRCAFFICFERWTRAEQRFTAMGMWR